MGGKAPKADPAIAQRQKEELARATAETDRLRKDRLATSTAIRRRQQGRSTLLGTEGGELGIKKTLLGGS